MDKNPLWVCHLIAAYQGPMDADIDPPSIDESLRLGETVSHSGIKHSAFYVESYREPYDSSLRGVNPHTIILSLRKWIAAVAAHEMGHQLGTQTETQDHDEGLLMSYYLGQVSTLAPQNSIFSPRTIRRFRTSNRWSE